MAPKAQIRLMAGELQALPRAELLRRPSTSPVRYLRQQDSQEAARQLSTVKGRVGAAAVPLDVWATPVTPPTRHSGARTCSENVRVSPTRPCTADGVPAFAAPQRRGPQRLPLFQPPHLTPQFQHSGAKAVKELAHRISQHCPPAHNWDTRRQELQGAVGMWPLSPPARCATCTDAMFLYPLSVVKTNNTRQRLRVARLWLAWQPRRRLQSV